MTSKNIRQHYVPQFYLKNFSNLNKKTYYINCFDKILKDNYQSKVSNIGMENNFYSYAENDFEGYFCEFESKASKIINSLVKNEKYKILNSKENRMILSSFLLLQFSRTNEVREILIELEEKIQDFIKNKPESNDISIIKDYFNEDIKKRHMDIIQENHDELKLKFYNRKWIFIENKTNIEFLTSDNPIVRYNNYGSLGFDSPYLHIFFPLSPKTCLCLLDPYNYSDFLKKKKFFGDEVIRNLNKVKSFTILDEDKVNCINNLQIENSTRHIFSKNGDFEKINYLIKNNLIETGEKRKRIDTTFYKDSDNDFEIMNLKM